MSNKESATPEAQEVNNEQTVAEVVAETPVAEAPKEATVAETLTPEATKEAPKIPDSIPYSRFKEKVDENASLKADMEVMSQKLADKTTTPEAVRSDIKEIAKEHNLDEDVLEKITASIEARAMEKVQEAVQPITQREQMAKQDAAFEKMFSDSMALNPEYEGIASKEVIKQLAFNPQNANKTLSQIIGEAYGGATKTPEERKTMENTVPRGGGDKIDKIDFDRAQKDSEYFQQIQSDEGLKKEYDDQTLAEVTKHM